MQSTNPAPQRTGQKLLSGFSIEVTPKTLMKTPEIGTLLPRGTTVFIAHIAGTPVADMVRAAQTLRAAGLQPKPHIPARLLRDRAMLGDWLTRYQAEAGVDRALLLAGGVASPAGDFASSMDLVETGLFDRLGFQDLSFAGHPEGSRDIDPQGGTALADGALSWKQAFAQRTDARVSLITQFVFDTAPVLAWQARTSALGIDLPIHVGLAGPASLQTLIRYGLSCGVGASLKVLQRRAADLRKLMLPFAPDDLLRDLATCGDDGRIAGIHLFPLGGITRCADWAKGAI
ncbi:MAG TPA: methylenetetrahydrofolate reductase [Paenirhodobacter sp.]